MTSVEKIINQTNCSQGWTIKTTWSLLVILEVNWTFSLLESYCFSSSKTQKALTLFLFCLLFNWGITIHLSSAKDRNFTETVIWELCPALCLLKIPLTISYSIYRVLRIPRELYHKASVLLRRAPLRNNNLFLPHVCCYELQFNCGIGQLKKEFQSLFLNCF